MRSAKPPARCRRTRKASHLAGATRRGRPGRVGGRRPRRCRGTRARGRHRGPLRLPAAVRALPPHRRSRRVPGQGLAGRRTEPQALSERSGDPWCRSRYLGASAPRRDGRQPRADETVRTAADPPTGGPPPTPDMAANYARLCFGYVGAAALTDGDVRLDHFDPAALGDAKRLALARRFDAVRNYVGDPAAFTPQSVTATAARRRHAHGAGRCAAGFAREPAPGSGTNWPRCRPACRASTETRVDRVLCRPASTRCPLRPTRAPFSTRSRALPEERLMAGFPHYSLPPMWTICSPTTRSGPTSTTSPARSAGTSCSRVRTGCFAAASRRHGTPASTAGSGEAPESSRGTLRVSMTSPSCRCSTSRT